jgi:uncharacterized membrane protein required for colicin V production
MGLGKILSYINWVDIVIFVLLFKTTYGGLKRGLINEIIPLVAIFIALMTSIHLYEGIGTFIGDHSPLSNAQAVFICFLFIGAAILTVSYIITRLLALRGVTVQVATLYDSIFGAFVGAIRGALLVSFVLMIMQLLPVKYVRNSVENRSFLAKRFIALGNTVYNKTTLFMKRG